MARNNIEERCFPRSIGAYYTQTLSVKHFKGNIFQCYKFTEFFLNIFNFEYWFHRMLYLLTKYLSITFFNHNK
ncbi:hypothetical protein GACE_0781 [Geoglobus acetivorans]|uniref:Uncharacterized protein n=1 Tax=Geoglobus acetivorans TaxID=565033 RepID=A0A0A7GFX1_GEOAI|nr:hypothetical protein GACE_0781 [Geoglobus acetivorans]